MKMSNLVSSHLGFFPKELAYDFGSKFQTTSKVVYSQLVPRNNVSWCFSVKLKWFWRYMKMWNRISHHLGFFLKGLAYDFGSKLPICLNFVYSQMWPENDICWCFRVKSKSFWRNMKISNLSSRHLWLFRKGVVYDFGFKFQISSWFLNRQTDFGNDVWWCFKVKSKWFWPYMSRTNLRSRHVGFFPKGLGYDFLSKF